MGTLVTASLFGYLQSMLSQAPESSDENPVTGDNPVVVATFYCFGKIDPAVCGREKFDAICRRHRAKGTLLVASEGINGTLAGKSDDIDALMAELSCLQGLEDFRYQTSQSRAMPFLRLKVREKREIVTMGVDGIDPAVDRGTYVEPADWNELTARPGMLVIDTRNDYEIALGTFRGSIDPQIETFRDFPQWVRENLDADRSRPIAMFCTGGIRCEKATALLKAEGYRDIFHLKGGILNYMRSVPENDSRFDGECFVFDQRVSVAHGLEPGEAILCHGCRRPMTQAGKRSPLYRKGVSCAHCHASRSDEDRKRYAQRQRQIELHRQKGAAHRGSTAQTKRNAEDAAAGYTDPAGGKA